MNKIRVTPKRVWEGLWAAWAVLFCALPFALVQMQNSFPSYGEQYAGALMTPAQNWMLFGFLLVSIWGPIILGLMFVVKNHKLERPWVAPLAAVVAVLVGALTFFFLVGPSKASLVLGVLAQQGAQNDFAFLLIIPMLIISVLVSIVIPPFGLMALMEQARQQITGPRMPIEVLIAISLLVTMFPVLLVWLSQHLEGAPLRKIMTRIVFALYIIYWVFVSVAFIIGFVLSGGPNPIMM